MGEGRDVVETRESLHMLAEHVVAPARYAQTGRIGLRASPGGFGTPTFRGPDDVDRQVLVRGTDIVLSVGDDEQTAPITTVAAGAAFVDVVPGAPAELYRPQTPLEPDRPLVVHSGAAREIADWFALGADALEHLRGLIGTESSAEVQLWPEHFDIATTIDEVNYGASPGDADHPEPYLYVGPWKPLTGRFWNEPFGASLPRSEVPDIAYALGFFLDGRDFARLES